MDLKPQLATCILPALLCLTTASPSHAGDSPYLFGDWNGTRTHLADQGITFDAGYTSEIAHNFTGGTRSVTRYTDQWRVGSTFDLDKLWDWKGGTFQIMVSDRNGRNLSDDANLGTNQQVQEVYGRGQTVHLTVFALDQTFFDGKLDWRIGRLHVGGDFASFSCDFQNLTFCGSQPGNIVGDYWVNWPTSQWGTRLKLQTSDQVYVQIGAYQLNPKYVDVRWAQKNGWKLNNPSGTTGAMIPVELGWTPKNGDLQGSYKIGAWYNNAGGDDLYYDINHQPIALTGGDALQRSSRYGAYINMQQQLDSGSDGQGTTVFFNLTQADRNTSATDRQIAMGLEYRGPFKRMNDMVGFALGATHPSSRVAKSQRLYNQLHPDAPLQVLNSYEYAAELFYNWSPVPSVNLRPNVQYILHPGGTRQNSNAFVFGLKTDIAF